MNLNVNYGLELINNVINTGSSTVTKVPHVQDIKKRAHCELGREGVYGNSVLPALFFFPVKLKLPSPPKKKY